MNLAHLHLILNHVPIVGIPIIVFFFAYGFYVKSIQTQRISLLALIAIAVVTVPVFLTGEPAEELIEYLPGVAKSVIESHEDAAQISLVLTLLTGAVAFLTLWFQKDFKKQRLLSLSLLGLSFLTILSLSYAGFLGGKVRHTEFNSESSL